MGDRLSSKIIIFFRIRNKRKLSINSDPKSERRFQYSLGGIWINNLQVPYYADFTYYGRRK